MSSSLMRRQCGGSVVISIAAAAGSHRRSITPTRSAPALGFASAVAATARTGGAGVAVTLDAAAAAMPICSAATPAVDARNAAARPEALNSVSDAAADALLLVRRRFAGGGAAAAAGSAASLRTRVRFSGSGIAAAAGRGLNNDAIGAMTLALSHSI